MSSMLGKRIKVSIFGESHGQGIGVVIDGIPAGERIDKKVLQKFLDKRAPGHMAHQTSRYESDTPEFLSGILGGVTTGAPICAFIRNENTLSSDYEKFCDIPRPSQADYSAHLRYNGFNDIRGGGHFSGRLTAPLCIAGGLALQILARRGVFIGAHIASIETVEDVKFDPVSVCAAELKSIAAKTFSVIDDHVGVAMINIIENAYMQQDSVGGIIECAVVGYQGGVGTPIFDGMENRLASAIFGIPAVRGIEFGAGFASAYMRGSVHNDAYTINNGNVRTKTNHHGGIIGGISTGMPILLRVAVKPTPSIRQKQNSVSLSHMKEVTLEITGRHDPCIVPRAVPCVEAVVGIVLLDMLLCEQE